MGLMQIMFGWPGIAAFLLVASIGVMYRCHQALIVAAVISVPNCFYLFGANNWIRIAAVFIPLSLIFSSYAIQRDWHLVSKIVLSPIVMFYSYLVCAVLNQ